MPKKAFRYVCPYCDTDYATEEEAEDCLNGHMMSDIYRARKFLCIYCDEVFDSEKACLEHEIHCRHRHEPVPEERRCCDNCELCTLEMRRTLPCPAFNFAPSRPACSEWRQVRK